MEMLALRCPSCGGNVKADAMAVRGWCPFCNTEFLIKTALAASSGGSSLEERLASAEQLLAFGDYRSAGKIYAEVTQRWARDYRGWLGRARCISEDCTIFVPRREGVTYKVGGDDDREAGNYYDLDPSVSECLKRAEILVGGGSGAEAIAAFRTQYRMAVRGKNIQMLEDQLACLREQAAVPDMTKSREYREARETLEEQQKQTRSLARRTKFLHPGHEHDVGFRFASVLFVLLFALLMYGQGRFWDFGGIWIFGVFAGLFFLYGWLASPLYTAFSKRWTKLAAENRELEKKIRQMEDSRPKLKALEAEIAVCEERMRRFESDPDLCYAL